MDCYNNYKYDRLRRIGFRIINFYFHTLTATTTRIVPHTALLRFRQNFFSKTAEENPSSILTEKEKKITLFSLRFLTASIMLRMVFAVLPSSLAAWKIFQMLNKIPYFGHGRKMSYEKAMNTESTS